MVSQMGFLARKVSRLAAAGLLAVAIIGGTAPLSAASAQPAAPAGGGLPLELNKLEAITQGGPGCRVYFLVSNPDAEPFEQLRLDLILFGGDGVIARRVALDLGPLAPKKQAVRLFDLQGLACDDVGKVLINDVIACTRKPGAPASSDTERAACLDRLTLSSRTKAPLTK